MERPAKAKYLVNGKEIEGGVLAAMDAAEEIYKKSGVVVAVEMKKMEPKEMARKDEKAIERIVKYLNAEPAAISANAELPSGRLAVVFKNGKVVYR